MFKGFIKSLYLLDIYVLVMLVLLVREGHGDVEMFGNQFAVGDECKDDAYDHFVGEVGCGVVRLEVNVGFHEIATYRASCFSLVDVSYVVSLVSVRHDHWNGC